MKYLAIISYLKKYSYRPFWKGLENCYLYTSHVMQGPSHEGLLSSLTKGFQAWKLLTLIISMKLWLLLPWATALCPSLSLPGFVVCTDRARLLIRWISQVQLIHLEIYDLVDVFIYWMVYVSPESLGIKNAFCPKTTLWCLYHSSHCGFFLPPKEASSGIALGRSVRVIHVDYRSRWRVSNLLDSEQSQIPMCRLNIICSQVCPFTTSLTDNVLPHSI